MAKRPPSRSWMRKLESVWTCRLVQGQASRARANAATSAALLERGAPARRTELWREVLETHTEPAMHESVPLPKAEPSVHMWTMPGRRGGCHRGRARAGRAVGAKPAGSVWHPSVGASWDRRPVRNLAQPKKLHMLGHTHMLLERYWVGASLCWSQ